MTPTERAEVKRRIDHANAGYGDDWLVSVKHAFRDRAVLLAALTEAEASRDDARGIAVALEQENARLCAGKGRESTRADVWRAAYEGTLDGLAQQVRNAQEEFSGLLIDEHTGGEAR